MTNINEARTVVEKFIKNEFDDWKSPDIRVLS